ncbi:MAG: LacI family DNA-binding transcriptional regulator [Sedimentisphaerales bacterium]|nr:LacI family DNA-binding transcriptional regulator [Sedimentisphaerales bacterium]
MFRKRVTLKDIAQKANFSVNTVSKVLSGQSDRSRISPRTANKIKKIANQLGYIPNQMARNLRAKHTGLIGVFVADMTDPIYAGITHAVLEELPKHSLFPLLTVAEAGIDMCKETWMRNRVEGLIFCGTTKDMALQVFPDLNRQNITAVIAGSFYNTSSQSTHIPLVSTIHLDNQVGIQLAVNHLTDQGCKKIAYITGPNWHSDAIERCQSYDTIIRKYHKPIIADVGSEKQYWHRGYCAAGLLHERKIKYDAIIAYDDLVAIGAIKWFTDHNIKAPADVMVMGFDNLPQAEYAIPSLTSLDQPTEAIGRKSVELLKSHLENRSPIEHVHLSPSLVIRDSTSK